MTITRRFILATFAVVSVAACRHQVAPLSPSAASETVRQFLAAVNANNLERMLELWGDERGPFAQNNATSPTARQQRLEIMQHLLAADSFRVVANQPVPAHAEQRRVDVELMRGQQRATVPFTLVPSRTGGWLVYLIDLNQAMPLSERGVSN